MVFRIPEPSLVNRDVCLSMDQDARRGSSSGGHSYLITVSVPLGVPFQILENVGRVSPMNTRNFCIVSSV